MRQYQYSDKPIMVHFRCLPIIPITIRSTVYYVWFFNETAFDDIKITSTQVSKLTDT